LRQLQYSSPAERPPLIISVGRLIEKKGLSVLIDACAILQQKNYEFQCQIVGTGALESTLHQQIQDLGLQSCVQIVGARPQNEVFQLVQQAAVFAAPYVIGKDGNRDGLPTVLLEAMALGTPCVSTVVTGIPEVVRDGETGLIVGQYDAEELAIGLGQLLKDSALRVKLSTQARSLIESEFDICRNTEVLRDLFLTQRRKGAKEE
jgi:glycosyltransferase involved in cell wall biosynthesis